MDTLVVGGVELFVYPDAYNQGRFMVSHHGDDLGALFTVVHEIMAGRQDGWVEGILERKALASNGLFASPMTRDEAESTYNPLIPWSSIGGPAEEEDCYVLSIPQNPAAIPNAIAAPALIEILSLLLKKSGFEDKRTPPRLGKYDKDADYAKLPDPPLPPTPPLKRNKRLLNETELRISELRRLREQGPAASHEFRVKLLRDMQEMGFFREDLITSNNAGIMNALYLSLLLSSVDLLRKYYGSAHRKTALGTTAIPNAIGGPLSYQLIEHTRSWDFGDHHPHEIYARFEASMRKLSNLEGDYGERKVEDGTFKATFHWEREDGIHASLTKVIVETW
jgi:hypothetical protein